MENEVFVIRRYSCKELALLYSPYVGPSSAVRILSKWIHTNEVLLGELKRYGWRKGSRYFTPLQVAVIVDHVGKPFSL